MRETKHVNKWRDKPCAWKGRLRIVKVSNCRFSPVPIKIPAG